MVYRKLITSTPSPSCTPKGQSRTSHSPVRIKTSFLNSFKCHVIIPRVIGPKPSLMCDKFDEFQKGTTGSKEEDEFIPLSFELAQTILKDYGYKVVGNQDSVVRESEGLLTLQCTQASVLYVVKLCTYNTQVEVPHSIAKIQKKLDTSSYVPKVTAFFCHSLRGVRDKKFNHTFEPNDMISVFVGEWVEGKTLIQEMQYCALNNLPFDLLHWSLDLLRGVADIHNGLCVHCDIKPDNIIINTREKRLYIIDYGSAICQDGSPNHVMTAHSDHYHDASVGPADKIFASPLNDVFAVGKTLEVLLQKAGRCVSPLDRRALQKVIERLTCPRAVRPSASAACHFVSSLLEKRKHKQCFSYRLKKTLQKSTKKAVKKLKHMWAASSELVIDPIEN
eukprot:GCRY01003626.1.p1 GENE.GCRY01003626.1~~GCRY01003626.1.p1  ORF type:complete len:391 (-),score=48.72 GCRY01003626.1:311-1483(-)